ncbi:hypothetical protein [Glaciecola punicea]|uniref:hypothetical protein n=1 Tax=Glaciecola punicea TaxID=56804 RepID=UPI0013051C9F|nr:hypothetical protein [Glaciecola punicea]
MIVKNKQLVSRITKHSSVPRSDKRVASWCCWALLSAAMVITGCESTTSNSRNAPILVGPSDIQTRPNSNTQIPSELINAEIFLDVAIPTFSPGLPLDSFGEIDGDELVEDGIWPQLRRTEAKLFASQMKEALDNKKVFASVSVVPSASTPSDLFVLGEIKQSDSEQVEIEITVLDSSGEILGNRSFEHTVSRGFLRDQQNAGKNPYQPVFNQASDYVVSLLAELSTSDKQAIKNMSLMRYARYYSPENYSQYLTSSLKRKNGQRYYKFELTGIPDGNDPMLQRIEDLRAQELLFVDRLQDNFEVFQAQTRSAYATWQEETLPEVIAAREAQRKRNTSTALAIGGAILTAILIKNANTKGSKGRDTSEFELGAIATGIGSIWAINEAFKNNSRLKVQSAVIEEQGQALDLSVSPTVIEFENETVELQGTAQEQYMQWKTHLRKVFDEEKTPDVQL